MIYLNEKGYPRPSTPQRPSTPERQNNPQPSGPFQNPGKGMPKVPSPPSKK